MDRSNFTNHIQCIYAIRNIETNTRYIGQTRQLYDRIRSHEYSLNRQMHDNYKLQEAWNMYGSDKFVVDIVEECSPELFNERETYWLHYFQPNVYNLGNTNMPGTVSEEIKQKIRDHALRGDDNPARRPEVRAKLVAARKDREPLSAEARARISKALTGRPRPHSEEHILALRDSSPNKRKVIQLTMSGDVIKIWNSINDASRSLGVSQANISDVCRGVQKSCKGFHWSYLDNYQEEGQCGQSLC